ncbi:MAG: hypothetical protein D6798_10770 [Deltaproteobacteria bacterium]|nr:MAG: hypothetical protein D6798_10770 [Deltaproteobacteria bacterium]
MMKRNLRQVWDQLRAQNASRTDALRRVRISGLRGIQHLEIPLIFPVSVLAGPNACGKSTVLFSMACAYRPPGAGPKDLVPSTLFPDFKTRQAGLPRDSHGEIEIAFEYLIGGRSAQMRWRRKKSWNRSGIPGGKSPERAVYLRTLANLSNPSEVRSLLQMGRHELQDEEVDAVDITLAHRILPWEYARLVRLHRGRKELLFVERDEGGRYSEFHMSSGERSVLRLSLALARLNNALVLIDEVEAGLHPFTQQVLMLELQRLALRNQLQIVVATHSSIILECVPVEARIFLDRQGDNVVVVPPHHDVIQRAFYGRALDRLSVVCEDESAEAVVRGIFDHLAPALGLVQSDIEIGRDTGKEEFKHHVAAFARFRQLWSTVFVLDGDGKALVPELEAQAAKRGQAATVICLPGDGAPELWAWSVIEAHASEYAPLLGFADDHGLAQEMSRIFQTYEGAADTESNKAKGRIWALANATSRDVPTLMRLVGRREAQRGTGALAATVQALRDAVSNWRNMRGDL